MEPFGNAAFWDDHYKNADIEAYEETYMDFDDLANSLNLYLQKNDNAGRILHMGCGLSQVSKGFWKMGMTNVTNIDSCQIAIEKAQERDKHLHGVQYRCVDCTDMNVFPDASFDYVIEKGLIDSLFCSLGGVRKVSSTLEQVSRVLRPGGYFISISSAPNHCRFPHLKRPRFDWAVETIRVAKDPGYYLYACHKRSYDREWFFGDTSALQTAQESQKEYVPPLHN